MQTSWLSAHDAADPLRALIVEDHEDSAVMLAKLLEHFGCVVEIAHDGDAGLAAAAVGCHDLMIVDISLPGQSGYSVAQQVRQACTESAPFLVALTGWGRASDIEAAHAAGFDQHLLKPVDLIQIQGVLNAASARRRENRPV